MLTRETIVIISAAAVVAVLLGAGLWMWRSRSLRRRRHAASAAASAAAGASARLKSRPFSRGDEIGLDEWVAESAPLAIEGLEWSVPREEDESATPVTNLAIEPTGNAEESTEPEPEASKDDDALMVEAVLETALEEEVIETEDTFDLEEVEEVAGTVWEEEIVADEEVAPIEDVAKTEEIVENEVVAELDDITAEEDILSAEEAIAAEEIVAEEEDLVAAEETVAHEEDVIAAEEIAAEEENLVTAEEIVAEQEPTLDEPESAAVLPVQAAIEVETEGEPDGWFGNRDESEDAIEEDTLELSDQTAALAGDPLRRATLRRAPYRLRKARPVDVSLDSQISEIDHRLDDLEALVSSIEQSLSDFDPLLDDRLGDDQARAA